MSKLKKNYRKIIFSALLIIGISYAFSLSPILICRGELKLEILQKVLTTLLISLIHLIY